MVVLLWFVIVLIGYLLGTLNGALLISKWMMHDDVRTHGSGNAGLTNFFRTYGGIVTLLVIGIDVVKCVLACLIARWLLPAYGIQAVMAAGVAVIFGHSYPVFAGFRGGKGILCGAALAGCADWRVLAIILGVFLLAVVLTRFVSLGSVLAATAFGISFCCLYWGNWAVCVLAVLAAVFVIIRHHQNIVRLVQGTESKFSFHKKV